MTLREELRENIDKVEDDATLTVTQEVDKVMALVDEYVRTVIGEYSGEESAPTEYNPPGLTLKLVSDEDNTRNRLIEEQLRRAGLEK